MIRFEQVGKRYPNGHVGLHELTFRVRPGEFLFVTGHSGAGKSTLMKIIAGVHAEYEGEMRLDGRPVRFRNPRGIDFAYLTQMIQGSWMSRANSIVIPGPKMDLAMQLILTPMVQRLVETSKRA